MAAPGNLNFELAGAGAGFAAEWFVRSKASQRLLCGFQSGAGVDPVAAPNAFDDASWESPGGALDVVPDATTAPDGTTTADRLRTSLLNEPKFRREVAPRTFETGKTYTVGCFMKSQVLLVGGLRVEDLDTSEVYLVKAGLNTTGNGQEITIASPAQTNVDAVSAELVILADGWTLVALKLHVLNEFSGQFGVAVYSGTTTLAESFVGTLNGIYAWGAFVYEGELQEAETFEDALYASTLVVGDNAVRALWGDGTIDPKPRESFEVAGYLTTISGGVQATFDEGQAFPIAAKTFEGYEEAWFNNFNYATTLGVAKVQATWGTGAQGEEQYEEEWLDNENYETSLTGQVYAAFDDTSGLGSGEHLEESYEYAREDREVEAVNTATDTMTVTAHGWQNNDGGSFFIVGPYGELPEPLVKSKVYYWRDVTANTFELQFTKLSATIDLTTTGYGELWVRADPAEFWYGPDFNTTI